MNTIIKTAAAAILAAGLFASAASAASVSPSQDASPSQAVVIAPASAIPAQDSAEVQGFKRAKIVDFPTEAAKGSIIINTKQNKLYFVLGNGKAAMYRVATAKKGFEWKGTHEVSRKAKWPSWSPPAEMRARQPELPAFMAGGPENPLGARALYLGSTIYRVHGTNAPDSIGKAASSGCIRMLNADVTELYQFVKMGAVVTVM